MPAVSIADKVPLTIGQKARLIGRILLLGFAPLVFIRSFIASAAFPPLILLLLVAGMIYVWAIDGLRCIRDLWLGVALVEADLLVGKAKKYRSLPAGEFARLGHFTLTPQAYAQGRPSWTHRVVYSPATRTVWSLEPLANQSPTPKEKIRKRKGRAQRR